MLVRVHLSNLEPMGDASISREGKATDNDAAFLAASERFHVESEVIRLRLRLHLRQDNQRPEGRAEEEPGDVHG